MDEQEFYLKNETEFIPLNKLLQVLSLAQTGGHAKIMILNKEVKVTPEILHSASDFTIYEGWRLKGWPIMTIFRGNVVMEDGDVVDKPRFGKYLHRKLLKKANT